MEHQDTPRLVKKKELARMFGLSPRTIDNWVAQRLIEHLAISPRLHLFDPEKVRHVIERNFGVKAKVNRDLDYGSTTAERAVLAEFKKEHVTKEKMNLSAVELRGANEIWDTLAREKEFVLTREGKPAALIVELTAERMELAAAAGRRAFLSEAVSARP